MSLPQHFLVKLKEQLAISTLIKESVSLTKKGSKWKGLCPFHNDKNPSMTVDDIKGRFKCWVCSSEGDIFDWELKIGDGKDFISAVKGIAERLNIEMPKSDTYQSNINNKTLIKTLYQAHGIYRNGISRGKDAKKYLIDRGLTDETIDSWEIGSVSKGIVSILERNIDRQLLIDCGIACLSSDGNLFDRLRQRIVIPLRTKTGTIVGFAGRKIYELDESPKYLNPPETEVFVKGNILFGLDKALPNILKSRSVIVVEGYFDVISLHQNGEGRAVAGMGTALTDIQLNILTTYAKKIIFCFDNDQGGAIAIKNLLPKLLTIITDKINVFFNFMPKDIDPDGFIRRNGIDAWYVSCQNGVPLSELLMQYITSNYQLETVEDKQRAAIRATEVCKSIKKAPYLRQLIIQEVEKGFGVRLEFDYESI